MTKKTNNLHGELWSEDDDLKLVEAILSAVRRGGHAIDGCRNFSESTNGKRTVKASKYRWHVKLKQHYLAALELAAQEGKENRDKPNQGKRYAEVMENVLNKEVDNKLTFEDVYVVMKRYRNQVNDHDEDNSKLAKENQKIKSKNDKLQKELEEAKSELKYHQEVLANKNRQYKELMNSLQVLKKAGIQINIPEEEKGNYIINNDGTVEKI